MLKIRDLASRPDLSIGQLTVSPSRRVVAGPSSQTAIEPRVMQVLLLLLDAKGVVVTRDQIFDECWGGAMVGDDSINRAIGQLRRALSQVAPGAFEIETIPRTGYRLVARDTSNETLREEGEVLAPKQTRSMQSRRWVLSGGLAAAAVGTGLWQLYPRADPATRLIEESAVVQRAGTAAATDQAVKLLRQAISLSPNNADAWGALALTLARAETHSPAKADNPISNIEQAARRALQLDPANGDAKAALAIAIPYYGDWLAAERRFDAVLAQHPGHIATMDARAFLVAATGRPRIASADRLKHLSAEPFDAKLQYRQIYALWMLNRISEADRVSIRAMEMFPRHLNVWFGRLFLLAGTGRFDRALAQVADPFLRPDLKPPMIATLQASLKAAKSRDPSEVEQATKQVLAGVQRSVAAVVNGMMMLNFMEATDAAFNLAYAYYLERGPIIAAMQWRPGEQHVPDQRGRKTNMLFTPNAATMQRDSRFLPLMRNMGLADYWRQRGIVPDFLAR